MSRAWLWSLILLCLLARAGIDWTAPLLDEHGFRQTQTALTVYWYLHDGIDLLRPPLPVFGTEAPSIPFEFPIYQAIVAVVLEALGLKSVAAIAAACRAVAFAFHLLAAWSLHRLARRHFSTGAADVAVLLWVAMPYPVFWSTTAMIEPAAAALALLFLDQIDRSARLDGRAALAAMAAAAVLGALAAVLKVTTFVLYFAAGGALYAVSRRLWVPRNWGRRDLAALALMAALPLAALFVWTGWADAVKSQNLIGGVGLTSMRLTKWNFGTWEQRFDPAAWGTIFGMLTVGVLSIAGTLLFLVGCAKALCSLRTAIWTLPIVVAFLVFFNLYYYHTYYYYAVLPSAVVLMAVGVATLGRFARGPGEGAARVALACLLVAAIWSEVLYRWPPWEDERMGRPVNYLVRRLVPGAPLSIHSNTILEVARTIREGGFPPGPIVVTGNDWSPDIAFYAERPAIMVGKPAWHVTGPCNAATWAAIRRASPAVFVKLLSVPTMCREATPVPECTVRQTSLYWIGTCMEGTRPPPVLSSG